MSGSELAVKQLGVSDELDYQKQQRTRELLRDLRHGDPPLRRSDGQSQTKNAGEGLRRLTQLASQIFPVDAMEPSQQLAL